MYPSTTKTVKKPIVKKSTAIVIKSNIGNTPARKTLPRGY